MRTLDVLSDCSLLVVTAALLNNEVAEEEDNDDNDDDDDVEACFEDGYDCEDADRTLLENKHGTYFL